ncbi:MAG: PPC domain-containing protein [Gemmataceae bacterium]
MIRFALLLLLASFATAQKKEPEKKKDVPKILYSVPLAATPGTKQKLALRGKFLDTVKDVKVIGADGAKVKVLGGKKTPAANNQPGERLGETELEIELELPKDAKPGAALVAGDSAPYVLMLPDAAPAVAEKEPNDGFDTAQAIPFPAAVDATIKADRDADVFKFEGKKGTKVRIEVQAAKFGSPMDGFLSLYDTDRKLLAAIDDVKGSPDPVIEWTLPRDGTYFVTVIDAHDLGGPQFGYRLLVK